MQILNSKILIIGDSEKKCSSVIKTIQNPWNQVVCAHNIEQAMKESILKSLDLIICFEECGEMKAFQIYTILNSEILKDKIPFLVILTKYNKNNILIGTELGIDGFIFPSFDQERILKVINLQLKKNNERKKIEKLKYDALMDTIPYGVFVAENLKITEINHIFSKLLGEENNTTEYFFRDIFKFNPKDNYELTFFRLVNGLEKKCTFKGVKLINNSTDIFDVSFYLLNKRGSTHKVIGIIKKSNTDSDFHILKDKLLKNFNGTDPDDKPANLDIFTTRECEILKLSAIGIPIKQIAERLNISKRTVEKHRSNIISKTKTGNIVEAVFLYSRFINEYLKQ